MNNEFDVLIKKGDPASLRTAYELLFAHERREGLPPNHSDGFNEAEELAIDWDALERIALSPTPLERIDNLIRKTPLWLQRIAAIVSVGATFALQWALLVWAQDRWLADSSPLHHVLLGLVLVMAATLSIVTAGGSAAVLIGSGFQSEAKGGRSFNRAAAGAFAALACLVSAYLVPGYLASSRSTFQLAQGLTSKTFNDTLGMYMVTHPQIMDVVLNREVRSKTKFSHDPAYRNVVLSSLQRNNPAKFDFVSGKLADQYLTWGVEVRASVRALRTNGLRVRTLDGNLLPEKDPRLEQVMQQVEDKASQTIQIALDKRPTNHSPSVKELTDLLIAGISRNPSGACGIAQTEDLHCKVEVNGTSFTGELPLKMVANNVAVFQSLKQNVAAYSTALAAAPELE